MGDPSPAESRPLAFVLQAARSVLDDTRAGVTSGGCSCPLINCPGPGSHWTPRSLVPAGHPKERQNEIRRTDNVSRLSTIVYAVSVLARDGHDDEATELESWTRARWYCDEMPGDADSAARQAWVTAHLRRMNPPERR